MLARRVGMGLAPHVSMTAGNEDRGSAISFYSDRGLIWKSQPAKKQPPAWMPDGNDSNSINDNSRIYHQARVLVSRGPSIFSYPQMRPKYPGKAFMICMSQFSSAVSTE